MKGVPHVVLMKKAWFQMFLSKGLQLNFPDNISSMKISHCRVNNCDDTNIRTITEVVVDQELEVGDVYNIQTLRMSSFK